MYGTVEDGPKCNRVERRQSRRPGDAATLWSRAVPGDRGCRRRLCGPRKRPHPAQGCCRARGALGRRRARTRGAYRHDQVFPTYTNSRSLYPNLRQRSDPRRDVRTSSRSRASVWQSPSKACATRPIVSRPRRVHVPRSFSPTSARHRISRRAPPSRRIFRGWRHRGNHKRRLCEPR